MKKLLVSALMLLATMSASAQMISAARDNGEVKFGVRASFAMSNMNQKVKEPIYLSDIEGATADLKQLPAFAMGVALDLPVLESFHFNIELKYAMKGQKRLEKAKQDDLNYETLMLERVSYLEMPIQPQFRLNLNESSHLNVNVGPYIGFAIQGTEKITTHVENQDDIITKTYLFTGNYFTRVEGESRTWEDSPVSYKAPISHMDVGLALGIDYVIEHFHVGVSYDLGLKDINTRARDERDNHGYQPLKNRTALFTLGVDF